MKIEPWMRVYPSVAAVKEAHIHTVAAWEEHLPLPQTDVERTVRRRVRARMDAHIAEAAPEVHAGMQKLRGMLERAGIRVPGNIFSPEE